MRISLYSFEIFRIGNLLGEKDAERAGTAARAALALVIVISAFTGFVPIFKVLSQISKANLGSCSIFVMIFAKYWAHLFNRDPGRLLLLPYFRVNRSFICCQCCRNHIYRRKNHAAYFAFPDFS